MLCPAVNRLFSSFEACLGVESKTPNLAMGEDSCLSVSVEYTVESTKDVCAQISFNSTLSYSCMLCNCILYNVMSL